MRCLSNQAFIASLVNLHEESIRIPFLMAYWNYINHALMATCGYLWPWPRTVLQCGVIGQHFAQPKELDSGDRGRSGAFQTRFDWSNLWRCERRTPSHSHGPKTHGEAVQRSVVFAPRLLVRTEHQSSYVPAAHALKNRLRHMARAKQMTRFFQASCKDKCFFKVF